MTVAPNAMASVDVNSHPEFGVRNSQPEGIGRVANVGDLVAWNNLGRNVVFAHQEWQQVAVFGTTSFPHDDELSQYDLDVHAILRLAGEGEALVLVLNHLGSVLGFDEAELVHAGRLQAGNPPLESVKLVQPAMSTSFVDDVERTVSAGARLVSSRPASFLEGGLLVSEPVHIGFGKMAIDADTALEGWGRVTALYAFGENGEQLMAVGGEGRTTLVPLVDGGLGRTRFEFELPIRVAGFAWDGRLLWVVGSELTASPVDDYRWEDLRGGRYAGVDPLNGQMVVQGDLPDDVAWGNGGVPVVMSQGCLCAVGRTGRLHWLVDPGTSRFVSTASLAETSLGIGHAAAVGDRVLYGFNRGGYRLYESRSRYPSRRA
ncbi:MAG TPA: hypothetical protein VEJ87_00585 [Acidimicrobiales bacterium]|nr:hypothetical protein [Acidimicrobiales bacterium]